MIGGGPPASRSQHPPGWPQGGLSCQGLSYPLRLHSWRLGYSRGVLGVVFGVLILTLGAVLWGVAIVFWINEAIALWIDGDSLAERLVLAVVGTVALVAGGLLIRYGVALRSRD